MRRIGAYEVCGLLGKGGMGRVYKARMPVLGKIVALKTLQPEETLATVLGMDELERRFEHEARIMASLRHPHVAQVWDYGRDHAHGFPYFVMEYFCNDLGSLIGESYMAEEPSRRLPLPRAVRYVRQTLLALGRMHYAGVVHRDIKPFNILLTDLDRVKVIDFGLSRLRGEVAASAPSNIKIGTPYYTAPEQETDPDGADRRADLFSVAVMLYRMLTGALPEPDGGAYRDPSALCRELTPAWDAFFRTALHPDRTRRHPDAKTMLAALDGLLAAWNKSLDAVCTLSEDEWPDRARRPLPWLLRDRPAKVAKADAAAVFGLDRLGRPATFADNVFAASDATVVDRASGLMWERGGSEYPLAWDEAAEYVAVLNARRWAGHADWRVPTMPELLTLVDEPASLEAYCVTPLFPSEHRLLWSADRATFMASWYLNAAMGFAASMDRTCMAWVRGVRTVRAGDAS
ncbi:MAG: protein kinase [Desulfovibrionaceae bacterium]